MMQKIFDLLENEPKPLDKIIGDLIVNRKDVGDFVHALILQKRIDFKIRPKTSLAFTDINPSHGKNRYSIILGSLLSHPYIFKELTFEDVSFSPKERIQYKLLHEVSHCFASELHQKNDPNFIQLLSVCKGQFDVDHVFFTKLASFKAKSLTNDEIVENSKNSHTVDVFEEDATELIAMALWSKQYFIDYLKYLSDPLQRENHKRLGVRSLSEDHAVAVGKTVLAAVSKNPALQL